MSELSSIAVCMTLLLGRRARRQFLSLHVRDIMSPNSTTTLHLCQPLAQRLRRWLLEDGLKSLKEGYLHTTRIRGVDLQPPF